MSGSKRFTCPVCGGEVAEPGSAAFFPFCGKRCKLVDLDNWFGGKYALDPRSGQLTVVADEEEGDGEDEATGRLEH